VTTDVLAELERLVPLAPLHQPHNLSPIRRLMQSMPTVPQIACFDTAFHRTQPEVAQRYALPRHWHDAGILRYGFHGLSYEYITSILPGTDPRAAMGRTVIAHLGNGASLCGVKNGRSIATTMGFTPTDGLMMGTRCGQLDPGVLLYFLTYQGMSAAALENLIDRESGLLGVSGLSSDMRILLASQEPAAREAIDLFVYRTGREIGSMAAALGGLDAIVFTGGIGEHAAAIRSRVCRDAAWLGVNLDDHANEGNERCISNAESRVTAWILPTNEELMIAHHARRILKLKEISP
jgi:acetate kinase